MSESTIRSLMSDLVVAGELERVNDDQSLLESGVLDSVVMIELIDKLEAAFDFTIGEDELTPENFDTIAAIARLVQRKRVE